MLPPISKVDPQDWSCPRHPSFSRDKPGLCLCGRSLIPADAGSDHDTPPTRETHRRRRAPRWIKDPAEDDNQSGR